MDHWKLRLRNNVWPKYFLIKSTSVKSLISLNTRHRTSTRTKMQTFTMGWTDTYCTELIRLITHPVCCVVWLCPHRVALVRQYFTYLTAKGRNFPVYQPSVLRITETSGSRTSFDKAGNMFHLNTNYLDTGRKVCSLWLQSKKYLHYSHHTYKHKVLVGDSSRCRGEGHLNWGWNTGQEQIIYCVSLFLYSVKKKRIQIIIICI